MDEWTLTIHGKPPPRPGKNHWRVIHRAKTQWAAQLGYLAMAKRIPLCEPGERRHVEIVFYRPGPVSDKDNAHTGCKVPLDALTRCGLIEDDSPSHIDLEVATVPSGKSRTVIKLRRIV